MTILKWRPRAKNIAHKGIYSPAAGTSWLRVRMGSVVVYGVNSASLADAISTMVAAFNASTHPYFTMITASGDATTMTLNADYAGVRINPVVEEDDGSGVAWTPLAAGTSTQATGLAFWDNAINWETEAGAVSATAPNGETVIFDKGSQSCLYNLPSAYDGGIVVKEDFTGALGLQIASFCTDAVGSTFKDVPEYRDQLGVSPGAAMTYNFSGNPSYVSMELFLVANDDPSINVDVENISASVGNQRACVEVRVMDETAGVAVTASDIYVKNGSFEFINQELTNYDLRFTLVQDGGIVYYSDLKRTAANTRRINNAYIRSGDFYAEIGASIGTLKVSGDGIARFHDLMITKGIYVFGGRVDFTRIEMVDCVAGWVIQHWDGEIESSQATPTITPTSYTIYPDRVTNFRAVFSSSFNPATIAMGSNDQLRVLNYRRLD